MGLKLRRQKCPEVAEMSTQKAKCTWDCARAHLDVSKTQGSYRVFRLDTGCARQLVNRKEGAVTDKKADYVEAEDVQEYGVGAPTGLDGVLELPC